MRFHCTQMENLATGEGLPTQPAFDSKVIAQNSFIARVKRTGFRTRQIGWVELMLLENDRLAVVYASALPEDEDKSELVFPLLLGTEFGEVKRHGNTLTLFASRVSLFFETDPAMAINNDNRDSLTGRWSRILGRLVAGKPYFDGLGISLPGSSQDLTASKPYTSKGPKSLVPAAFAPQPKALPMPVSQGQQRTMPMSKSLKRISLCLSKPVDDLGLTGIGFGEDLKSVLSSLNETENESEFTVPHAPFSLDTAESSADSDVSTPSPSSLFLESPKEQKEPETRMESILQKEKQEREMERKPPSVPAPKLKDDQENTEKVEVAKDEVSEKDEVAKVEVAKVEVAKVEVAKVENAENDEVTKKVEVPEKEIKEKERHVRLMEPEHAPQPTSVTQEKTEKKEVKEQRKEKAKKQEEEKKGLVKTVKRLLRRKSHKNFISSTPTLTESVPTIPQAPEAEEPEVKAAEVKDSETPKLAKAPESMNALVEEATNPDESVEEELLDADSIASPITEIHDKPSVPVREEAMATSSNNGRHTAAVPKLDSSTSISALSFRSLSSRSLATCLPEEEDTQLRRENEDVPSSLEPISPVTKKLYAQNNNTSLGLQHSASSSYSSFASKRSLHSYSSLSSAGSFSTPSLASTALKQRPSMTLPQLQSPITPQAAQVHAPLQTTVTQVMLFTSYLWISKWESSRWTPLSQLELRTEVQAASDGSGDVKISIFDKDGVTIVSFTQDCEVRRVSAHDTELRTFDDTYMFRSRDQEQSQRLFRLLWGVQANGPKAVIAAALAASVSSSRLSRMSYYEDDEAGLTNRRKTLFPPTLSKNNLYMRSTSTIVEE